MLNAHVDGKGYGSTNVMCKLKIFQFIIFNFKYLFSQDACQKMAALHVLVNELIGRLCTENLLATGGQSHFTFLPLGGKLYANVTFAQGFEAGGRCRRCTYSA